MSAVGKLSVTRQKQDEIQQYVNIAQYMQVIIYWIPQIRLLNSIGGIFDTFHTDIQVHVTP